tara:strand:- start:231 stop:560 length:330 start_codon:yes stop_codon:yes gene_type:complete
MKKPFKETKVGKLLNSKAATVIKDVVLGIVAPSLKIGTGAAGGIVAGIGAALKNEKDINLASETGGVNKINYARIVGYLIFAGLVALLIFGKIDQETFEYLFGMFENLN